MLSGFVQARVLSGIANQNDKFLHFSSMETNFVFDNPDNPHSLGSDISHNFFVGGFLSGLGRAQGLVNISAYSNNFTGKLPEDLGELSKLEYLDLRGSYFEGSIPKSFKGLLGLRLGPFLLKSGSSDICSC